MSPLLQTVEPEREFAGPAIASAFLAARAQLIALCAGKLTQKRQRQMKRLGSHRPAIELRRKSACLLRQ